MQQQQQQQQEEEPTIEAETNENQEQNDNNNDSISQKSAQVNSNHLDNGVEMIHQDGTNDDTNHNNNNKDTINPNVMEIKGIVQGEADNNVVQSASRFSAVDDEDNKV